MTTQIHDTSILASQHPAFSSLETSCIHPRNILRLAYQQRSTILEAPQNRLRTIFKKHLNITLNHLRITSRSSQIYFIFIFDSSQEQLRTTIDTSQNYLGFILEIFWKHLRLTLDASYKYLRGIDRYQDLLCLHLTQRAIV